MIGKDCVMNYKLKSVLVGLAGIVLGLVGMYVWHIKMSPHEIGFWICSLASLGCIVSGPGYGIQIYIEGKFGIKLG